jgi:hypothetical protein
MEKRRELNKAWRLTRFFLICLATIFLCQSAKAAGNLIVYDLLPDLLHYLRIAPEEKESRAKLFAQLMIRPHPEIYDRPQIFKADIGRWNNTWTDSTHIFLRSNIFMVGSRNNAHLSRQNF